MKTIFAFWSVLRILIISIPVFIWSGYWVFVVEENPHFIYTIFFAFSIAFLFCIYFCSTFEINIEGGDYAHFKLFIFADWTTGKYNKDIFMLLVFQIIK